MTTKWVTPLVDIYCPRGGSQLGISFHFFRTGCTHECWYCTKPMITCVELFQHLQSISFIPTFEFFQVGYFLHWIPSSYPQLFCSLYDNGFPLYLSSSRGLLCWWISVVPEVVLNLVYLSIFSGLVALMSADIVKNLWSLVCSCLNSYWAFHLFPLLIFFKLVAFCTEFNLFSSICFVLFMIMYFPYICHHQEGYSAGGYPLSPRWFLTWYIYPFFRTRCTDECWYCTKPMLIGPWLS